ncbi:DUF92 domain-containing protein [Paenibacillus sp. y28]|uniref:DUF92 domain-containing protein n=1 Tax=Paenibacillus sp. y28 TaxID=3129110 RepID=UPI00301B16D3
MDWWIGGAGSLCIAALAYWRGWLSRSGAIAAGLTGTLLYALGTSPWFGLMIAFFITSSVLSKWKRERKRQAESGYEKSGARDAGQVLANGGMGVLLCVLHALWPQEASLWAAYVGVMAAVTADTWATEVGGLSRTAPRSILNGRKVPAGTSGGVTPLGIMASLAGGTFIGAAAWGLAALLPDASRPHEAALPLALLPALGAAGGLIGSLADSLLGATLQQTYRCTVCGRELERSEHCGRSAMRARGLRGMNNDAVNVLGSWIGGAAAVLLWVIIR